MLAVFLFSSFLSPSSTTLPSSVPPPGCLIVPGVWCWGRIFPPSLPWLCLPLPVALSRETAVSRPLTLLVGALTTAG